jgi:nuclear pore complex protein Nup205
MTIHDFSLKAYQALDFLSSHRDTVVILLRSETDYVPLALVEEIHLLVSLCASVLPFVPKSELVNLYLHLRNTS